MAVLTPDHHFDDLVVGLRSGHIGRDIGAVPEHGALVGELRDLVHAVRNEQERQPLLAQALEDDEHLGDVGGGQRRSRLVENEEARLARQRLGDLHHLPARQRQILDQRHRMDVGRSGARERILGEAPLRAPVDQPETARRIGDGDVVGDRKVGNERKLLEDADNAGAVGGGRRIESDFRPVEHDASGVRRDDAGQDLDQRRLARAVLAENGVNAAREHGEIRVGERPHAAIALGYALHAQDRRGRRLQSRHAAKPRPSKNAKGPRRAGLAAAAEELASPAAASSTVTCSPSTAP